MPSTRRDGRSSSRRCSRLSIANIGLDLTQRRVFDPNGRPQYLGSIREIEPLREVI